MNNRKIFVDTGAFLALANRKDQHHLEAQRRFQELRAGKFLLVTSNFILDESYTRLQRKAGMGVAIAFGESLQQSRQIKILSIDRALEEKAWQIFKKYQEHAFSYTDCTSFALMQHKKIHQAFAFDKDFKIFGFKFFE